MIVALVNAGFDADEVDEYFYFWQFCSLGIPGESALTSRADTRASGTHIVIRRGSAPVDRGSRGSR